MANKCEYSLHADHEGNVYQAEYSKPNSHRCIERLKNILCNINTYNKH